MMISEVVNMYIATKYTLTLMADYCYDGATSLLSQGG
jgi:hypothetical protein